MKDLEEANRVVDIEVSQIQLLKKRFDERFVKALDLIMQVSGKVIVTGMGKSGLVGRKIAATLTSTGTPAVFLHPAESSHGDLGVVSTGDLVLAISYNGESVELQDMIKYVLRKGVPLVAMTGNKESSLAKAATVVLDIHVEQEACPLKLAPTSSTTLTMVLGDALAMALLKRKNIREENFAEFHPGGSLGRRLLLRVSDLMHKGESLPLVPLETPMRDVIGVMTQKEVRGVAGVVDANQKLVGLITDGDLRRRLEKSQNPLEGTAKDLMSLNPKTIDAQELAEKSLFLMEQFRIQVLFVVNKDSDTPLRPIGILHLQDLLQAKIR